MKVLLFALSLALAPSLFAGTPNPLERDLGQGLTYFRVHALPTDLPAGATKLGAVVLDLRYAHADDSAASALAAWLPSHTTAATPVFVLVNAETAASVLDYFSAHEATAGLVILGAASARFAPDIAVRISAKAERTAYAAFEHGTALAALLHDPTPKIRHDEAAIAKDRANPPADEAVDTDPDSADAPEATSTPPAAPPPVIDDVLLRAVQLHRALVALKQL